MTVLLDASENAKNAVIEFQKIRKFSGGIPPDLTYFPLESKNIIEMTINALRGLPRQLLHFR
jgi:hypothetical protein